MSERKPVIGITTDLADHPNGSRVFSYMHYARAVAAAGGFPVLLPPLPDATEEALRACDGFVFAGGDDPRTEPFGAPTHARAVPVQPDRQAFETALLLALAAQRPDAPALGVCLGMQMMALVAGGALDQYLPESLPTHADHWERDHAVEPVTGGAGALEGRIGSPLSGRVRSKHRQAVADPGRLRVVAAAPDGVIEAVIDPARRFYLGVQWHPERTDEPTVGVELFGAMVAACRA